MINEFIKVLRSKINTPFHHLGRNQYGLDCVGLLIVSCKEININLKDVSSYTTVPSLGLLEKEAKEQLIEIGKDLTKAKKGDILLFKFINDPQHVAIITEIDDNNIMMIHSYQKVNKVVEHNLDKTWLRRLVNIYRLKELE